ncbi:MAG: GGDEF domain-containing protein [Dehalococcoidia bacterium]
MARRWHDPVTRGERARRSVAVAVPGVIALAGIAVTAEEVFPRQDGVGLVIAGLFVACAASAWGARRFIPPEVRAAVPDPATRVLDTETGLGNSRLLISLLRSEVARAKRYGHRSVLMVIEVAVTGFRPLDPAERPPSPARFVAATLMRAVRQGDLVVRIDESRFGVLLVECNDAGAEALEPRLLHELTATPFSRNDDGSAIFLKARSSRAVYDQTVDSAEEYYEQALASFQGPSIREHRGPMRQRIAG